jgi:hypothetical protein
VTKLNVTGSPTQNAMKQPANVVRTLVRWVHELSPSCKEAARLQSIALDRTLTPFENFGLRNHQMFCKWCRVYGKQIRFLHSVAKEHELHDDQHSQQSVLSSEARERIKQNLQSGQE